MAILPPDTVARVAIIHPRNIVPASQTIQARLVSYLQKTKRVGIRIVRKDKTNSELFRAASEVSVIYSLSERSAKIIHVTSETLDVIARPLSLQLIAFITSTYHIIVTMRGIRYIVLAPICH